MPLFLPPLIGPARNARVQFDVFAANERWERRRGARVPWDVYRGDRRWTPPLRAQWSRALDPSRNPMLAEVEHAVFLAEARNLSLGDVVAGRLVAWAGHEEGTGYFGAFEAINDLDLTEALFSAAEMWFFEHVPGLEVVRGPVSVDPLCASGLLVDGFDAWPAAFLPYNPPYYPELLTREEFELRGDWQAYALDLRTAVGTRAEGRSAWGIRIAGSEGWPDAVSQLLSSDDDGLTFDIQAGGSFSTEVGPERASRSVLSLLASGLEDVRFSLEARLAIRWLRPRALVATAWEAGEPVGAAVGVPDNSTALRRANGRLLPLGWLPYLLTVRRVRWLRILPAALAAGYSEPGLALDLYAALAQAAAARGFDTAIVGPFRKAAGAQAMAALGARVMQTYQICEKRY